LVANAGVSAIELVSIKLDKALLARIGTLSVASAFDAECLFSTLSIIAICLVKLETMKQYYLK
jgi:hypothetical protein